MAVSNGAKYPTYHINGVCISSGNAKIGPCLNVSTASSTCPKDAPCHMCNGGSCYAERLCKLRTNVASSYDNNADVLYNDPAAYFDAVRGACKLILALNLKKVFRWHVCGDMASVEYVQQVVQIAREFPDIHFIAMTKAYSNVNAAIDADSSILDIVPHDRQTVGNLHLRFSTWAGYACDNRHGLPTCDMQGDKEVHATTCPQQAAKKNGKQWDCTKCAEYGVGCCSANQVTWIRH